MPVKMQLVGLQEIFMAFCLKLYFLTCYNDHLLLCSFKILDGVMSTRVQNCLFLLLSRIEMVWVMYKQLLAITFC